MEFNVANRLWLLNFLFNSPPSTLADYGIIEKLKVDLSFPEEEQKEINLRNEGADTKWDVPDHVKEIEIGERAKDIIVKVLEKVAKTPVVNPQNVELFRLFDIKEE